MEPGHRDRNERPLAAVPRITPALRRHIPANPADYFTEAELERARAYRRPLQRAEMLDQAIGLAALVLIISTGAARGLLDATGIGAWPLRSIAVLAFVFTVLAFVGIPVSAWTTFTHEARWGFNAKTVPTFIRDQITEIVVLTILGSAMLIPVLALVRATDLWWLWGALTLTAVTLLFGFLYPIVILPLSNRFTPLEDPSLVARLEAIAERAGVTVSGFSVMNASKRTRKDNAFVAGLGASRKVVIFDNLLASPPEHIESVVAHEIGHWRRGHVFRGLIVQAARFPAVLAITAALTSIDAVRTWAGVDDLGDPAALPLFLLAFGIASGMTTRGLTWFARWLEREADLDSLELTRDPDSFRGAMHSLAVKNLPDIDPSWWARTKAIHPPIAERLAFADEWERSHGGAPRPAPDDLADQAEPTS
jgi:STE24 endopeptidase